MPFTPELIHLDILDSDVGNRNGHAAIFVWCQVWQKGKHRAIVHVNFLNDKESVVFVVEGSDLGASED